MGVILDGSWGGRTGSGDLRGMGGGGEKHELVRDDQVLCACGSSLHTSSSF